MIKISIIIPIYKVEKYLKECVNSVLNQSYENIEVILVDDGSPDNCPMICDEYVKSDNRIIVIHKENGGLSDARNVGLKRASGEYIIFLDSDDFWEGTDGLSQLISIVTINPEAEVVFFQKSSLYGHKIIYPFKLDVNAINNRTKVEVLSYLNKKGNLLTSAYTKMIKRKLLVDNNIYFQKGLLSEDYDWSLSLYCQANNFFAIDNPFYIYRKRLGSITMTVGEKNLRDLFWILDKWDSIFKKEDSLIPKDEIRIYRSFLSYVYCCVLGLYSKSSSELKNAVYADVKKRLYFLDYAFNYKSLKVKRLYNILGFYLTTKVLKVFMKYKSRNYGK